MKSQLSRRNKSISSFNDYEKNTAQVYSQNMITKDLNNLTIRSCPTVYPKTIQGDELLAGYKKWILADKSSWIGEPNLLNMHFTKLVQNKTEASTSSRTPHYPEISSKTAWKQNWQTGLVSLKFIQLINHWTG